MVKILVLAFSIKKKKMNIFFFYSCTNNKVSGFKYFMHVITIKKISAGFSHFSRGFKKL